MSASRTTKNVDPRHFSKTCQGGELNSRPRAYESPALPLSYPGNSRQSWLAQAHVSTERVLLDFAAFALLLRLGTIGREIFFAAAHCRHKTDAVRLFHYAAPTF